MPSPKKDWEFFIEDSGKRIDTGWRINHIRSVSRPAPVFGDNHRSRHETHGFKFFKMACLSFTDTQSARRFGYFLWQMNVYAEKRQDLAAGLS